MLPKNERPVKVKGNPKLHKPDIPYRIIISGIGHATEKIAFKEILSQDHT